VSNLWLRSAQILYLLAPLVVGMALLAIAMRFDLLPRLRKPIDGGATLHGRRIFGAHKTWRGALCSLIGCIIGVAAQSAIGDRVGRIALIEYATANVLLLGATLSLGATGGELVNSFVKRQLGVAPGERGDGRIAFGLYVFDQVDSLVTLWPLLLLWLSPPWPLVALSFVWVFALHQVISLVGYLIGVRRTTL